MAWNFERLTVSLACEDEEMAFDTLEV